MARVGKHIDVGHNKIDIIACVCVRWPAVFGTHIFRSERRTTIVVNHIYIFDVQSHSDSYVSTHTHTQHIRTLTRQCCHTMSPHFPPSQTHTNTMNVDYVVFSILVRGNRARTRNENMFCVRIATTSPIQSASEPEPRCRMAGRAFSIFIPLAGDAAAAAATRQSGVFRALLISFRLAAFTASLLPRSRPDTLT